MSADTRLEAARPRLRVLSVVHSPAGPMPPVQLDGRRLVIGREPGPGGLQLDDARASRRHCELVFSETFGVYRARDLDSKNGTHLGGRLIGAEPLPSGSVLRIGDSLLVSAETETPEGLPSPAPAPGESLALARALQMADLAAASDLAVLIHGPTGAGKEVLARRIHERSGRAGRMVSINCATFTRELLASELFGHVRGAFSGARDARAGLFVEANGGTLLLDEIAELPADQQPALLRAIQERCIRPVGSDREVPVNVRLIAASHADLHRLQAEGVFRADLYARLAGVSIDLPGLADRREEILPLFLKFLDEPDLRVTPAAAERLLLHAWPHNIRELQHAARAVKLFAGAAGAVTPGLLPATIRGPTEPSPAGGPDRGELERLLAEHAGNVSRVAQVLGESRQSVYRMLRAHGLDPERYRTG